MLVASCTTGLIAALLALRVRGIVVVPSFTFPATAHAVALAGCQPMFCDVSPVTWELDPDALLNILQAGRIGAVIHVRSYGFGRDLSPVERLTRRFGVPLIVDAAAALGGRLNDGRWIGHQGELEVFSLHATKVFGIGEGGVIFAPPHLVANLRAVINFGLVNGNVLMPGLNGKLSELHAAVGLAVLNHIEPWLGLRRRIAQEYRACFSSGAGTKSWDQIGDPAWQSYPLLLPPGIDAHEVLLHALNAGVELRRYYFPALHQTPCFGHCARTELPNSEMLARRMLCLPVHSDMAVGEIREVALRVQKAIGAVVPCPTGAVSHRAAA